MELDHREPRIGWTSGGAASAAAIIGSHLSILIQDSEDRRLVPESLRRAP
jgi:hypothetical protein